MAEREAELDVQHARLAVDAQPKGLVEAALDARDLAVDPAEDLDGAAERVLLDEEDKPAVR